MDRKKTSVELPAILKPGGVSTITKSDIDRSVARIGSSRSRRPNERQLGAAPPHVSVSSTTRSSAAAKLSMAAAIPGSMETSESSAIALHSSVTPRPT